MIRATEITAPIRASIRFRTSLGYPFATVVVGVARDQDDRDTTGRDKDGTAR
jgi:hypothetical protein